MRVVAFFRGKEMRPLGLKPAFFSMLNAALKRRSSTVLLAVVEGHLE